MNHRPYDPGRHLDAVKRIWREVGWLEPDNDEQVKGLEYFAAVSRGLVAEIGGEAECFAATTSASMRYLDTELAASGVTGVTTSHVARRQGLGGRLTAAAVAADAADGAAVSALGMFDQGFYDQLGFGTGTQVRWRGFNPADLRVPAIPRSPLRLGFDDWEDVHASRRATMPLHGAFSIVPSGFTRAEMHFTENGFGLGYRDESGALTHHLWLEAKAMEQGPLTVTWAAYRTYAELLELLGVLQGLGDQFHMVRMREPVGFALQDLLVRPFRTDVISKGSTFETGTRADSYWQARICDLNACVAAVEVPGQPVDFNLVLEDPIADRLDEDASWRGIAGDYVVHLGEGSTVTAGTDPSLPTLEASVGAFTRLWLGVLPASGLAATDRLVGPTELLQRLDGALRLPQPDYRWDF